MDEAERCDDTFFTLPPLLVLGGDEVDEVGDGDGSVPSLTANDLALFVERGAFDCVPLMPGFGCTGAIRALVDATALLSTDEEAGDPLSADVAECGNVTVLALLLLRSEEVADEVDDCEMSVPLLTAKDLALFEQRGSLPVAAAATVTCVRTARRCVVADGVRLVEEVGDEVSSAYVTDRGDLNFVDLAPFAGGGMCCDRLVGSGGDSNVIDAGV